MSIRDQEYGASLDLQQLYPFRMKFNFVEVGPVEVEIELMPQRPTRPSSAAA
jgi:hypothetical protein